MRLRHRGYLRSRDRRGSPRRRLERPSPCRRRACGRAVRVGEKEVSERAEIVARYAELFTRDQLAGLREAESEAGEGEERERLYRLRKTCEAGLISAELAEREDALENAILAARVEFKGEQLPLRTAQAQLAVLTGYADRDELGRLSTEVSATFNDERLDVLRAGEKLEADVSGIDDPVERNEEEKGISLSELEGALAAASEAVTGVYDQLKERWVERLLGPEREQVPSSSHIAYLRRLSPLEAIYTKEQAVPVCMDTLKRLGFDLESEPNIKLDLDDRPQKSPRACVIPADPPKIVHLITRAQGGLHDYQAFLHEAGHALHYAGCDPALPYTFRNISRDHALTEIYSYIVEAISRQPGWHARYFDLSDEEAEQNAEATVFMEALLFRRYAAKLQFELDFWGRLRRIREAARAQYMGSRYARDVVALTLAAGIAQSYFNLRALDALCERLTGAGRLALAMEVGLASVAGEPLRESAHRAVIKIHLAEGNKAEALRQYRLYRNLLHERLGLSPSAQIEKLVVGFDRTETPE